MKRQRKSKTRATDKRSTGEKVQDMAIRSISYSKEDKKKKGTESNIKNLDDTSNISRNPKKVEQQEKTSDNTIPIPKPEASESLQHNPSMEIKESANMMEGEHLKDDFTSVNNEEPLDQRYPDTDKEIGNFQQPQIEASSSSTEEIRSSSIKSANLEERPDSLIGSNEILVKESSDKESSDKESIDKELQSDRNRIRETRDNEQKEEELNKENPPGEYAWLNLVNAWSDLYIESVKNMNMITEHWLGLFKPWFGDYKKKDKIKVE